MKAITLPSLLFGLPLVLDAEEAQRLVDDLEVLWARQMGCAHADIDHDLDLLHKFFNPVATGKKLRTSLDALPPLPDLRSRLLAPPLVLGTGRDLLLTPEGRTVLDVLTPKFTEDDQRIVIDPATIPPLEHELYVRYRAWGRHRLEDVLRLRADTSESEALRTPSVAFLLFLLVNGSRTPETAVKRPGDDRERRQLDAAIASIFRAFSEQLDGREEERDSRHYSLYSGYPVTEARRRLSASLSPDDAILWIRPGQETRVLKRIAQDVRRPHKSISVTQMLIAFDALVSMYRQQLPTLAAMGLAHEDRAQTLQLRTLLRDLLEGHGGHDERP